MHHRMTTTAVAAESPPQVRPGREPQSALRRLLVHGTAWTLAGHAGGEAIRFAGHLVTAWILDPAAFGVMVIVNVVLQGLRMFSDLGTGPGVVQHPRGEDPLFLDTAWSLQIVRGAALFLVSVLIAAVLSWHRADPMLMLLIPAAALSAVAGGFESMMLMAQQRRIALARLTIFDLAMKLLGAVATVTAALLLRSVWALVIGGVAAAAARTLGSFAFFPGHAHRFRFDRAAVRDLVRFGRWIFISTALTFLCTQGDKLILAEYWTTEELGLYGIASFLALTIPTVMRAQSQRVLFPLYARMAREEPGLLRRRMSRIRIVLHAITMPVLVILAVFAPQITGLLYPARYAGLDEILRWLSFGAMLSTIELTVSPVLLAQGDSLRHMIVLVVRTVLMAVGMITGGALAGSTGFLAGLVAAHVASYPVLAWAVSRHGVWMPRTDLSVAIVPVAIALIGIGVMP